MKALSLLLIFMGLTLQDPRSPIPSESEQNQAEKTIREVFKDEYSRRTPAGAQVLGKKLLEQGLQTKDDIVSRYVLLRESAELGARGGDIATAL